MRQFLDLVNRVISEGGSKEDVQGVGNIAVCGAQMRFDLRQGFPIITTRKMYWKSIVLELLWFLRGDSKLDFLHEQGVHFWDAWAGKEQTEPFGREIGDVGPIYGTMWRHWPTTDGKEVDQIALVVEGLLHKPYSRRYLVTTWNPELHLLFWEEGLPVEKVWLAPCHGIFHLFAQGQWLDLHLIQRSGDLLVGVPFNISSYALLLSMIAQVTGLNARFLVHTISDCHVYRNHIDKPELWNTQRIREPRALPKLVLNPEVLEIDNFKLEDCNLEGYNPHPAINYPVAL